MIRLALVFLTISTGAAMAQSIPVRTAEHDGFTRIAIDFRRGMDWRVEQDGRSVRILTDGMATYDLSDAYRRIGPQRIKAFRQAGPRELLVELACACSPETFMFRNSLVLDVLPQAVVPMTDARRPNSRLEPRNDGVSDSSLLPGLLTRSITSTSMSQSASTPVALRTERAAALRARLNADLGIDPGHEATEHETSTIASEADGAAEAPRPSQMQVESRTDRDTRGYETVVSRATCPAFSKDTLESWVEVRQTLSPEAGDEAWTAAEAKRLIALGFGMEAERLLDLSGSEDRDNQLLARIARLVDAAGPAPDISAVAECGDMLTLFALISDPPELPLRLSSVLDAIAASPDGARSNLRRRAVAGLMALGREEDARIVAAAGSGGATPDSPPDLTSLTLAAGDGPVATNGLEEIVSRRTPEAAAAIRLMVDGMVDEGTPVPPRLLDQARALLPETSGSNRDRLQRAVIRAETASGRYLRAAEDIDSLTRNDPDMAERLLNELVKTVQSIEDDALFLTQIVSLGDRPAPDPELRIAVATRIAENHVPQLARRILSESADVPSTEERLLRASLALQAQDDTEAEAQLAGLKGPEADSLREEIAVMRAAQAPLPLNDPAPIAPMSVRARGGALVEQSATLRSELEKFLGD
ncbi:hypothetical protein [Palleronia sp.]|uniref:hypothetical protein n=1 Tax=Palleronia sp. TaxID=1940284 RepID=UPI0035C7EA53